MQWVKRHLKTVRRIRISEQLSDHARFTNHTHRQAYFACWVWAVRDPHPGLTMSHIVMGYDGDLDYMWGENLEFICPVPRHPLRAQRSRDLEWQWL